MSRSTPNPTRHTTSLAQIVAALSVTYKPAGVVIWLFGENRFLDGARAVDLMADGRIAEVADAVRRIGDADPDDFTITDTRATS